MATITLADLMNDKKPSHNGNSNGDGIEGVIKRTSSGMPRRQHRYTRSNGTLMGCCEKCGGILASFDKVENNKLVCSSCGHGNDYDVERYNTKTFIHNGKPCNIYRNNSIYNLVILSGELRIICSRKAAVAMFNIIAAMVEAGVIIFIYIS